MLTVKSLIAALEALAEPDAPVFFFDGHYSSQIRGGLLDREEGTGRVGLLLTNRDCSREEGGF